MAGQNGTYTTAGLSYLEAVNAMNSFYPMEVIATAKEINTLLSAHADKSYLVFTEDRLHPIKMPHDLPQRWVQKGMSISFSADALKGENFSYQLGIYPTKTDLQNVKVQFSDLKDAAGHHIPASVMHALIRWHQI